MKRFASRWILAAAAAACCHGFWSAAAPANTWAIYVMNADGSDVQRIRYDPQAMFGSPCWLNDGKRIAYDGGPNGFENSHIFVHTLGEGTAKDIGLGNTPCFSPDDQQVAFFMTDRNTSGAKPGIYVMNADGANREWICEGSRPRWSPDGEKLVIASGHEGFPSLYVYDTVSLERTRVLARGYELVVGAAFSPDSSQLVFVGFKGGQVRAGNTTQEGDVAIIEVKADSQPEVVCEGRVGWHPDWSPMSNKLLFRISDGGMERLHILDLEGDKQPAAIPNQLGGTNRDATWSPDGNRIVFVSDRE
jgi:Tol biopolymer transport system component